MEISLPFVIPIPMPNWDEISPSASPTPPRLVAGIDLSLYIQPKCKLREEGGRLQNWGGELGSHLPSELEEGSGRRARAARDRGYARCLTTPSLLRLRGAAWDLTLH
jgi:hypothetical protein